MWDNDEIHARYKQAFERNPDVHIWALMCWIRDDLNADRQRLANEVEQLTAELAEREQYEPITGHIIMVISGQIQDVQAHSISGLPLPEGHAVCKLTLHPRDATD